MQRYMSWPVNSSIMKKGSFGAGNFGLRSLTSCLLLDHIYIIDETFLLFFAKSNRLSFQS
jgi:hypothetical protein